MILSLEAGSDSGSPLAIVFYITILFVVMLTLLRRYLIFPTHPSGAKRGANRPQGVNDP